MRFIHPQSKLLVVKHAEVKHSRGMKHLSQAECERIVKYADARLKHGKGKCGEKAHKFNSRT